MLDCERTLAGTADWMYRAISEASVLVKEDALVVLAALAVLAGVIMDEAAVEVDSSLDVVEKVLAVNGSEVARLEVTAGIAGLEPTVNASAVPEGLRCKLK